MIPVFSQKQGIGRRIPKVTNSNSPHTPKVPYPTLRSDSNTQANQHNVVIPVGPGSQSTYSTVTGFA